MYPIFIGHGPDFKKNFKIEPFKNVDLYPLMCYLLKIEPHLNNGSLTSVLSMVIINQNNTGK
jgi:hypothetical protein